MHRKKWFHSEKNDENLRMCRKNVASALPTLQTAVCSNPIFGKKSVVMSVLFTLRHVVVVVYMQGSAKDGGGITEQRSGHQRPGGVVGPLCYCQGKTPRPRCPSR